MSVQPGLVKSSQAYFSGTVADTYNPVHSDPRLPAKMNDTMASQMDTGAMFASRLRNPDIWLPWSGLVAISLISALVYSVLGSPRMPKIPIALQDEVPSTKERIEIYSKSTRNLLVGGYTKACISAST